MRISDCSSDVCSSDLLLPPVSTAPCFAIRKPAAKVYTLEDYVADRIMMPLQADALRKAVRDRRNILIAGGTSSGKTTPAHRTEECSVGKECVSAGRYRWPTNTVKTREIDKKKK